VRWVRPAYADLPDGRRMWDASDDHLAAAGWVLVDFDGTIPASQRVVAFDPPSVRAKTQAEIDAEAASVAATEAAQLAAMAEAYGQMVAVLRANLVAVGHDIPVNSRTVTIDLMGRAAVGVLSPAERAAKDDIFQLYILLKEAGVTDSDIAAIWSAIQPGE
jgi:hypothetical protein